LLHRTKEILESVDSGVVGVADLATALLATLETHTGHYFTTTTNCLKGALVDPTQCRFLQSWGVAGDLIEDGWKKIGAECADFHNVGVLPPGLNVTEVYSIEVKNLRHFMEQSVEPVDGNPLDDYHKSGYMVWKGFASCSHAACSPRW
jgi:hypothetical protein